MKTIRAANGPATLIRTLDGRITFWSPGMEVRYGFAAEQAFGQTSHQLLRTTFWQTFEEIQTGLVDQRTWCGGLIHRRADGHPVMSANYWHLHSKSDDECMLVTEVHADIISAGSIAGRQVGDIMATIAQEMSQSLTAIVAYLSGSRRALQPAWPERVLTDHGLAQAIQQLARTNDVLRLMRGFSEHLREFERRRQGGTDDSCRRTARDPAG